MDTLMILANAFFAAIGVNKFNKLQMFVDHIIYTSFWTAIFMLITHGGWSINWVPHLIYAYPIYLPVLIIIGRYTVGFNNTKELIGLALSFLIVIVTVYTLSRYGIR